MEDFIDEIGTWLNLNPRPTYFYWVTQDVYALNGQNEFVNDYHHSKDFKDADLREARSAAIDYLSKRHLDFPEKFYFKFVSPEEWNENKNKEHARYSYSVSLVEWFNDDDYAEFIIAGEDEEETTASLEHEAELWLSMGLGEPPYIIPLI
jgi:hypothetical protein